MMASFDQLITDRRLTRWLVDEHPAASRTEASLLLGEYVCLASGGSSGLRGIFVQTLDQYTQFVASAIRGPLAEFNVAGGPLAEGIAIGLIGAASPMHSSAWAPIVTGLPGRVVPAPATLRLEQIVARLNDNGPQALQGYPSLLRALADERRAGRLRIAPRSIISMGETLTDGDRAAIAAGFGAPVSDLFVFSEGLVGRSEPGNPVLTFATDLCIVELVDRDNQPVPDGVASARVLVTNLHNLTQPLIRYELTDQFTARPGGTAATQLRPSKDAPTACFATAASSSTRPRSARRSPPPACANSRSAKPSTASTRRSSPAATRTRTPSSPSSSRHSGAPVFPTHGSPSGRSTRSNATPKPARPSGSSRCTHKKPSDELPSHNSPPAPIACWKGGRRKLTASISEPSTAILPGALAGGS